MSRFARNVCLVTHLHNMTPTMSPADSEALYITLRWIATHNPGVLISSIADLTDASPLRRAMMSMYVERCLIHFGTAS